MGLYDIPTEVRQHIASFLNSTDVLNYANISKLHKKDLGLSILRPEYLSTSPVDDGSLFRKCQCAFDAPHVLLALLPINTSNQQRVHSVVLNFLFRFDNQYNIPHIKILVESEHGDKVGSIAFEKVSITTSAIRSGNLQLHEKKMSCSFTPKSKQKYLFWYSKRPGLTKKIHTEKMQWYQIVFQDFTK